MSSELVDLRRTLPGIGRHACHGDNLSILLAGYFEPGIEDDEMDESETWKQGAIDAANRVMDAIHEHYSARIEALEAENARLREALEPFSEACKQVDRGGPDNAGFIGAGLTLGELRAARRAREGGNEDG